MTIQSALIQSETRLCSHCYKSLRLACLVTCEYKLIDDGPLSQSEISPVTSTKMAVPNQHQLQHPSINPENLRLSKPTKYEVANSIPHHRQYISYQNGKLQLLTPDFNSNGLKLKESGSDFSVLVPIVPWMRNQLNLIETFAEQNVSLEDSDSVSSDSGPLIYKPLWGGDMMYVQMSRWCLMFRKNLETGHYDTIDVKTPLERGTYNITIEVPYVYIGPHKRGENYSLSMRIVQIVYEPSPSPPASFKPKTSEKRGRPRKNVQVVEAQKD